MTSWDKYADKAGDWSGEQYADARTYLARRAELVRSLGPRLAPGDILLDLACGDGGLADFLPEQRYVGVDASEDMVAAGRRRGRELVQADLNDYEPPQPVQATTIFRAIYYARDRRALFVRIGGYTEKKIVFDLNPRQYSLADVRVDLLAAGFDQLDAHPFFVSQTRALPFPVALGLRGLERVRPLAELVLRARFTFLCAASRRVEAL
ncbi:MAG: methyltransferase domain-containing protein [Actinomycetota bacterium]|nr:methyltransferase domain-containing protein [Actinomycetota bacterium]